MEYGIRVSIRFNCFGLKKKEGVGKRLGRRSAQGRLRGRLGDP